MLHQPSIHGVIEGQATDLEIQAREILKTKHRLIKIYVDATGKAHEDIEKLIDRDNWMSTEEAKDFGLIDEACKEDELMVWAETKLKKWTDMPRIPWQDAKASLRRPLLDKLRVMTLEEAFGKTLKSWWDGENRSQIGKLVQKLSGK